MHASLRPMTRLRGRPFEEFSLLLPKWRYLDIQRHFFVLTRKALQEINTQGCWGGFNFEAYLRINSLESIVGTFLRGTIMALPLNKS